MTTRSGIIVGTGGCQVQHASGGSSEGQRAHFSPSCAPTRAGPLPPTEIGAAPTRDVIATPWKRARRSRRAAVPGFATDSSPSQLRPQRPARCQSAAQLSGARLDASLLQSRSAPPKASPRAARTAGPADAVPLTCRGGRRHRPRMIAAQGLTRQPVTAPGLDDAPSLHLT